jgi:hypothetical protein
MRTQPLFETEEMWIQQNKMEYLRLIIQEGKLSMDPVKLSGIRDWPIPTSVKQVQGFIGFANFYR